MRIWHTSDWHVGRTFHGHSTLESLETVLAETAATVAELGVDVVVVAGDVYDSSTPSAEAIGVFNRSLRLIRDAGPEVVVTAGNHDSPTRLGSMSDFVSAAGVHVITRPEQITSPVTLTDEHGPVHLYGIPFLEPARLRHVWDVEPLRSQADAVGEAMRLVRADAARRGGRSVVLAHTFVAGAEGESCESERAIVGGTDVGGVDRVPVPTFDGVTYAALGHIHGRSVLSEHVRYSGAPLHLSFSEESKPRGAWLVDLDAGGLASVVWVDLAVPRRLVTLTGTLDALLTDTAHAQHEGSWIRARLTDPTRQRDAMRRLQARFPHCAHLEYVSLATPLGGDRAYRELVHGKTDLEVVDTFLGRVRGAGLDPAERDIVDDVLAHGATKDPA
ncbi:exonuclease SbcCD subunit D [Aeromicrobium sp. Leaf350]|uniref:exonuclease SbcCD subunit D n=1 Tax=Aeromicrobium sp. Leaf350 TaxID=2876565 RepID=UPI001E34240B|nr:exonuclease SbcCD subunit D [Aeromicrobium sp. Leaf350]